MGWISRKHLDSGRGRSFFLTSFLIELIDPGKGERKPQTCELEFDHWLPHWMGGSDGQKNIWFEPHAGKFGSLVKDKVELLLYRKVCVDKTMSLNQAKTLYLRGWTKLVPPIQKSGWGIRNHASVCSAVLASPIPIKRQSGKVATCKSRFSRCCRI